VDIILHLDDPAEGTLTVLSVDNTAVSILSNILGYAVYGVKPVPKRYYQQGIVE